MSRSVYIDGKQLSLAPSALLGQGGEAEVYDLGDGRVVKWWKPANHPDFEGLPDAQAAATARIAQAPPKLRMLPSPLPREVVVPIGLARATKGGRVTGYLMPRVTGTPLHAYGEPKWRQANRVSNGDVVAALLSLHTALVGLHRAGIVVGDCNDLNVLVEGQEVHLIDVDSYQYGSWVCSMFSERFVDPRLCDASMRPVRQHDSHSDWFAFAAMAFRSLLGVGPWGGVYQPPAALPRIAAAMRPAHRLSVLGANVVYPRAARPLAMLPDQLLAVFRGIFEQDRRGEFPRDELERLRFRACSRCGAEHASVRCPGCQAHAPRPPLAISGGLKWQLLLSRPEPATREVTEHGAIYLTGDALLRTTRLGAQRIGSVLARQTRVWVGEKLGIGFYRAGGVAVGFVFHPQRGTLDDRVQLPRLRGQLVDAHAVIGDERAWLFITLAEAGRLVTTCIVVGADARVHASEALADQPWIAGAGGACAAGPHLFVPTDEGIARIEVVQGAIAHTRTFPETAPLVGAGDWLALAADGLAVVRTHDAVLLKLS